MISFAWPWLLALLCLPWVVRRLATPAGSSGGAALKVPFFHELAENPVFSQGQTGRHSPHTSVFWVAVVIWSLLITSAARPEWVGEPLPVPVSGRNVLMAVDISGSMEIPDFSLEGQQVTRLTMLKKVGGDFIQRRTGDRVGLIVFGSQAYLHTPLTFDLTTVQIMLQEAEIGLAGKETAIGDALGLAVKRLREQPDEEHILVLLTDGANTAGEIAPLEAARLAQEQGIRVYTIGIGATQMEIPTLLGTRTVNPSRDLDETTLQAIASLTGGMYFRAKDTRGLEAIYRHIDEMEPVERDSEYLRPIEPLFMWPLGCALLVSLFLALSLSGWMALFSSWVARWATAPYLILMRRKA